jgi:hypothetical protein
MADPIVVAALAAGAAFVLLTSLVLLVVFRRRDPTDKAVAGYAVTRQALGETAARATSTTAVGRGSGEVLATQIPKRA